MQNYLFYLYNKCERNTIINKYNTHEPNNFWNKYIEIINCNEIA